MYNMMYVRGKKIVTYEDYELEFRKGISVIRGPNRSGKSLSLSVMGNVFYAAPPIATKKNSAKRLLHANSSMTALGFASGKHVYHIEQFARGKGVGYRIFKHKKGEKLDAKKHNIHIRGDVKAAIRKLFRQKEDLFYNVSYISVAKPNPLQFGKPSDRYAFFQRVFNLEVFDKIRKHLDKEYKALLKDEATLIYLRGERERLPETLDLGYTKKRLKKARTKYEALNKRVQHAQRMVTELTAQATLLKQLSDPKLTLDQVDRKIARFTKDIAALETEQRNLHKQQAKAEEQEEFREKREKLEANLKKLAKVKGDADECAKTIKRIEKTIPTIEDYLERAALFAEITAKVKALTKQLGKTKLLPRDDMQKKLDKANATIANARETIDSLSELEGHKECPTCKHHLDAKMIKRLIKEAQDKHAQARDEVATLKIMRQIHDLDVEEIAPPALPKGHREPSDETLAALRGTLAKETKRLSYLKLKQQLREKLALLPEVKPVRDVSKRLKKVKDALKEARAGLERCNQDREVLTRLAEYKDSDPAAAVKDLARHQATIDTLGPQVQTINHRVQTLRVELAALRDKRDQIVHLDEQIVALTEKTSEIPVYRSLIKAYGPKGLRIDRITQLAELYAERLNRYAPLIFGEQFHFSVALGPNQFDIIAKRSGIPGDINMLSTSETRCFQLLSMLALLSMVPRAMRTNFVVLDELESNMDPKSRKMYANEYLPKLKELVECVFVITPLPEQEFFIDDADHKYMVNKTKGVSTLKMVA